MTAAEIWIAPIQGSTGWSGRSGKWLAGDMRLAVDEHHVQNIQSSGHRIAMRLEMTGNQVVHRPSATDCLPPLLYILCPKGLWGKPSLNRGS
jgi:hypothetical protein